jgi:hypothetical protein
VPRPGDLTAASDHDRVYAILGVADADRARADLGRLLVNRNAERGQGGPVNTLRLGGEWSTEQQVAANIHRKQPVHGSAQRSYQLSDLVRVDIPPSWIQRAVHLKRILGSLDVTIGILLE